MELSQRTGQLSIVSLMGRGTLVPAKVLLCSRGVKNAVLVGNKQRAADSPATSSGQAGSGQSKDRDQRSEVGGQMTDDRGQRSEIRDQRSEDSKTTRGWGETETR